MLAMWLKVAWVDIIRWSHRLQDHWVRDLKREWSLKAKINNLSLDLVKCRAVAKLEWDFKMIDHLKESSLILPFHQDRKFILLVSRKRLCLLLLWPLDSLLEGLLQQLQVPLKTSTHRMLLGLSTWGSDLSHSHSNCDDYASWYSYFNSISHH